MWSRTQKTWRSASSSASSEFGSWWSIGDSRTPDALACQAGVLTERRRQHPQRAFRTSAAHTLSAVRCRFPHRGRRAPAATPGLVGCSRQFRARRATALPVPACHAVPRQGAARTAPSRRRIVHRHDRRAQVARPLLVPVPLGDPRPAPSAANPASDRSRWSARPGRVPEAHSGAGRTPKAGRTPVWLAPPLPRRSCQCHAQPWPAPARSEKLRRPTRWSLG
jgi:hypothetical protein